MNARRCSEDSEARSALAACNCAVAAQRHFLNTVIRSSADRAAQSLPFHRADQLRPSKTAKTMWPRLEAARRPTCLKTSRFQVNYFQPFNFLSLLKFT